MMLLVFDSDCRTPPQINLLLVKPVVDGAAALLQAVLLIEFGVPLIERFAGGRFGRRVRHRIIGFESVFHFGSPLFGSGVGGGFYFISPLAT